MRALGAALLGYGLAPGSRVAVLGEEGRATLVAQLAALAAGAVLVPLDPALPDESLRDALSRTGVVHAIAADERQLARLLAWRPDLPSLDLVLLMEAAPSERRPAALTAGSAVEVGSSRLSEEPDLLRKALSAGDERADALVFAGAAGRDKAISRADLTALAGRIAETVAIGRDAETLVVLPVTSLPRLAAALAAVSRQATLFLGSPAEPLDAGLAAHGIRGGLVDSESVGRLHRRWVAEIEARSWLSRAVTRWGFVRGSDPLRHRLTRGVADALVLKSWRRRFGGAMGVVHVVGPPLHPEIQAFFSSIRVPLRAFDVRMAR